MEIFIDGVDFFNLDAMKYYSFAKTFKGNKKAKAKELVFSEYYYGSRKMDGIWTMIIKDMDGNFHSRSRTESVNGGYADKAEWIPHICKELEALPNGTALIGEIYFPDNEGSRKVTSVLNCLKDTCLSKQEKGEWLHFYVFDVVAYAGKSMLKTKFINRISTLNKIAPNEHVEISNYVKGEELWELYLNTIENGGEGIVITHIDSEYYPGKRPAWKTLKLKKELEDTIDAFCDGATKPPTKIYNGRELETWPYWIDDRTEKRLDGCHFIEYTDGAPITPVTRGYYNGWVSAISFSVMDNGKPKHIAWISNIPDEIKANPDKFKDKVAALTAMEIECIDGKYSFRHGSIEYWRDDKKPEDCGFNQIVN